jgi:hypothetical protein
MIYHPKVGDKMAQVHRDRFAERPHLRQPPSED